MRWSLQRLAAAAHGSMALREPRTGLACRIHLQDAIPSGKDPREIIAEFRAAVNMNPDEMERWLSTPESRQAVEQVTEAADKEGRHAARRIVELLRKSEDTYYEGDLEHMFQITQYIACHRDALGSRERGAEGGREATEGDSMLRFHLMNFGYDPQKERSAFSGGEPESDRDKRQRL